MEGERDVHPDFRSAAARLARARRHLGGPTSADRRSAAALDSDVDGWVEEWLAAAALHRSSAPDEPGGPRLAAHRAAASCEAAALALLPRSSRPERYPEVLDRHRASWLEVIRLSGGRRTPLDDDGELTFFPAGIVPSSERLPVVLAVPGCSPASEAWGDIGAAAVIRGHHWAVLERLGNGIPSVSQVSAAVAALRARRDVRTHGIVLVGLDEGSYVVASSMARPSPLVAAVVLAPGVIDVGASWTDGLVGSALESLEAGDRVGFEHQLDLAEAFSPTLGAVSHHRAASLGLDGMSPYDRYRAVRQMRLSPELLLDRMGMPVLIVDGETHAWPGQPERLHDHWPWSEYLLAPGGDAQDRIFEWIERHVLSGGRHP